MGKQHDHNLDADTDSREKLVKAAVDHVHSAHHVVLTAGCARAHLALLEVAASFGKSDDVRTMLRGLAETYLKRDWRVKGGDEEQTICQKRGHAVKRTRVSITGGKDKGSAYHGHVEYLVRILLANTIAEEAQNYDGEVSRQELDI